MRIFNDVLHEEVLSQTPNGLRYHLIDLTLEELALVNAKAPMPMTEATFLDCLEPYFAMASVDIGDDSVKARVMENIISKFLEDYSFVSTDPAKDKEGNPLTMDEVHVGTIADQIGRSERSLSKNYNGISSFPIYLGDRLDRRTMRKTRYSKSNSTMMSKV